MAMFSPVFSAGDDGHQGKRSGSSRRHVCPGDQRARATALGSQRVIANTTDSMEDDGAFQRIFRLSLVEFAGCTATLFRLLDPVEREQG